MSRPGWIKAVDEGLRLSDFDFALIAGQAPRMPGKQELVLKH